VTDQYPLFFYKYFPNKDWALDGLSNSYSTFSSRKGLNDLFDSKIDIINPTPNELKLLRDSFKKQQQKQKYKIIDEWFNKGKMTDQGEEVLKIVNSTFNKTIDSFIFLCVSKLNNSSLMWSHYANAHEGFCIEFKSTQISARKVEYKKDIATINSNIYIPLFLNRCHGIKMEKQEEENVGKSIIDSLLVKLKEWEYEQEYRYHLAHKVKKEPLKDTCGEIIKGKYKVKYTSDFIESVIFGCRTSDKFKDKIKEIIKDKMPTVKIKQAYEMKSSIGIRLSK